MRLKVPRSATVHQYQNMTRKNNGLHLTQPLFTKIHLVYHIPNKLPANHDIRLLEIDFEKKAIIISSSSKIDHFISR